jgi:hypothetical protein
MTPVRDDESQVIADSGGRMLVAVSYQSFVSTVGVMTNREGKSQDSKFNKFSTSLHSLTWPQRHL